MARRSQALLLLLSALFAATLVVAQSCSSTSKCPESAPCCASGQCGSGALSCAGGCHPGMSFKPTSCQPNPVCRSQNINFQPSDFNNSAIFNPILNYNGTASTPFTLDAGTLGKGSKGVLMELRKETRSQISTTNYILYGDVEATVRHDARAGLVAAFIFMSDVQDEIDWEFTTASSQDAQTNTFALGINPQAQTINQGNDFSVSDFHTYGVNWQPNQIQWKIDGNVVRTLTRDQANGNFPQTPSRVQFSTWAGGNATNPEGVISWSGGPIDWSSPEYLKNGFYPQEITSFTVKCNSPSGGSQSKRAPASSNAAVTSWVYTGNNISGTNRPEFVTSTAPLPVIAEPGAGGLPGQPGYKDENPQVTSKNSWDGSGDTLPASKRVAGSGGSGGGGGSIFNSSAALKYGVPIAAAIVGLIVIWAFSLWCYRRHRNNKLGPQGDGIKFGSGVTGGAMLGGGQASKYAALKEEEDAPMGAQRQGNGYGPASGPRPGQGIMRSTAPMRSPYADSDSASMDYPPRSAPSTPQPNRAYHNAAPAIPPQYQMSRPAPAPQAPYAPAYAPRNMGAPPPQHYGYPSQQSYAPSAYSQHSQAPSAYSQHHVGGYAEPSYRDY